MSARTGIPIASLDCYLGTRATVPSVDSAAKIAHALHVSVEYLVSGENTDEKQFLNKPSREAKEIIRWIHGLKDEQRRAILTLVKAFMWQKPSR